METLLEKLMIDYRVIEAGERFTLANKIFSILDNHEIYYDEEDIKDAIDNINQSDRQELRRAVRLDDLQKIVRRLKWAGVESIEEEE